MHDGAGGGNEHQPGIVFGVGSDPKVLVATAVAALVLAGSAYVWRRGSRVANLAHAAVDANASPSGSDNKGKDSVSDAGKPRLRRDATGKGRPAGQETRGSVAVQGSRLAGQDAGDIDDADDMDDVTGGGRNHDGSLGSLGKSARGKERRRRGKDPMKELMKSGGGKLAKILKATDAPSSSGTGAVTQSAAHSRTPSQSVRRASTSRQKEKFPSEASSTSYTADSSSSSTAVPHAPFTRETLISPSTNSSFSQSHRSRSRSRSRSRPPNESAQAAYEQPSTSKNNVGRNSDAASTISSASSSTTTEATTHSSTSTAPSSLTSSMSGGPQDADATPKAEVGRVTSANPSSTSPQHNSPSKRGRQQQADPWEWDGVGSPKVPLPSPPIPSNSKAKSRASSTANSSGTEGTFVPYSSVVSAKSPKKEDNRSTVGARAETKEDYHSSSSFVRDAETVVEEEEEVTPLVFPSLNNPAPDSSSASSFSVGHASTASSLSRPHSRSSSSSGASSSQQHTGKGTGRGVNSSNLAPFSVVRTGTPPLGSGMGSGSRRAPTPLGASTAKRPATPVGGTSAASSPLLASNAIPPSPSSQSFGHLSSPSFGVGSTIAVSAQTQVASLRGALEASRLREQKQKDEVEKIMKEKDMLQWEHAAAKRREVELQGQVHQMMHQLHAYAACFSSMNNPHGPHPVASPLHQLPNALTSTQTSPPDPPPATAPDSIDARPSDNVDHGDGAIPVGAGEKEGDNDNGNDITGGNSDGEKACGDVEGSTAARQTSSVPDDSASPAKGEGDDAELESAPGPQDSSQERSGLSSASSSGLPLPPGPPHPPPIAPPAFNSALAHHAGGMMSHSILHSPMGGFPHYPLHATQPVGFGPHGHPGPMPCPMPFPFHVPSPLPLHSHQQHPFAPPFTGGSAPQSPGGMMMPYHLPQQHNPFVVNPNVFHRPSTPGSASGVGAMMMNGSVHPLHHPHTPVGMGMGVGLSGSSPFAVGGSGVASGSASPDLTGSPSSVTALLMHDRSRRRMSSGSAAGGSGLARSARGRPSVLPLDSGIGRRRDGARNGKSSSGSSVNGEAPGDGADADGDDTMRGGLEEGQEEDEEEGEIDEVLAGAILKRPDSIRMASRKTSFRRDSTEASPSTSAGLRLSGGNVSSNGIWSGYGHGSGTGPGVASTQGESDEAAPEEEGREFVFPSLSDVGPVVQDKRLNGNACSGAVSSVSPPPSVSSPVPAARSRPSSSLGPLPEEQSIEGVSKSDSAP